MRAQTAPASSNVSSRAIASGISLLDAALELPRVEVDAEALERRLDPLEHGRHGIAGKRRELGDVLALVAVLGWLLPAPHRLDRGVKALHLRAGVVVVVLALDVVAGECQKPRDRVAVRAVSRRGDRDGPGRIRGHHLDLDPLPLDGRGGPERLSRLADLPHAVREPGVRQPEVHESGTCGLGTLRQPVGDDTLRDLGRDLARRTPLQPRELERDVRRVVAVLGVARPFERDGRACELGERAGESCDGIHPAIVRRR